MFCLFLKNFNFLIKLNNNYNNCFYLNSLNSKNYFKLNHTLNNYLFVNKLNSNNSIFYKLSFLNFAFCKNFFNLVNLLFKNKINLLFIDNNNFSFFPLYNYIYGFKNFYQNKNFLYLSKKNLTRFNFSYFYKTFLIKNNIGCLFFIDSKIYKNFISLFSSLNIVLIGLLSSDSVNVYFDFFFFLNKFNYDLIKYQTICNVYKIYFYNYNYKNVTNKYNFIKLNNRI